MDLEERVAGATRETVEQLTPEEIRALFARTEHPRAYIGFEPSGQLTVAHLIPARKMLDLLEVGCDLTVFLADWHAWINEKLGSDRERIRSSGRYMQAVFTALGIDPGRAHYRWASELVGSEGYWNRVVRVAKATSVARTRRAMTILGRGEEEENLDTAKLLYPSMQVADIFELPVEIAYGGLDQRRAHVLARETAHHYGWAVPTALHTPLLSSLKGGGRMDLSSGAIERKMSKSDPTSGIPISASSELIRDRLQGAFCPAKTVEGNPVVEIVRYLVFPWEGRLRIPRPEKFGGPRDFDRYDLFESAWIQGEIHPQDLKAAAAGALDRLVAPVRRHLAEHPEVGPATFLPGEAAASS
jgi:tyrosyl-tRNA synthetase